jgi:hypothetical protein
MKSKLSSLGILKFKGDNSFNCIGGYFVTIGVKKLYHDVVHLLLQYFPSKSLFQDLFEILFGDFSFPLLVQHFSNQLALVQLIEILSHFEQILVKINGFGLLSKLINKIENRFGGMMIVLINHGFLKFMKVNFPIEKGKLRFKVLDFFFGQKGRLLILFVGNVEISLFFTHGLL